MTKQSIFGVITNKVNQAAVSIGIKSSPQDIFIKAVVDGVIKNINFE